MSIGYNDPVYAISVVARTIGLHPQTLRHYERRGLIRPSRSSGNMRLYSQHDIDRLMKFKEWIDDLGVNLAGVEVMAKLSDRVAELESQLETLTSNLVRASEDQRSLPAGDEVIRGSSNRR